MDVATLLRGAKGKLPQQWLQAVGRRSAGQRARALRVTRIMPAGASDNKLKPGDVIVAINNHMVTSSLDVDQSLPLVCSGSTASKKGRVKKRPAASARTTAESAEALPEEAPSEIEVRIFRDGAEVVVPITPTHLGSEDHSSLLLWAGIVLRETPRCILERCGEAVAARASGIFAQAIMGGSPADNRDLISFWFMIELNDQPVKTMQDVLEVLESTMGNKMGERYWMRLRALDLNGQEHVRAIQCDPLFFPTLFLHKDNDNQWTCRRL